MLGPEQKATQIALWQRIAMHPEKMACDWPGWIASDEVDWHASNREFTNLINNMRGVPEHLKSFIRFITARPGTATHAK
jgi:hypothetical protein